MLNSQISNDDNNWESFLQGDRVAFANLYKNHAESLFKYGFKITSNEAIIQDTVNELFIDLWNQRARLYSVEKPRNYIFKAFRYKLLESTKKEIQFQVKQQHPEEAIESSIESKLIQLEQKSEKFQFLYRSLDILPERQREVIHLKYLQNLTTKEIAEILEINPQSVTNLLFRGLTNLRRKTFTNKISPK